MAINILATYFVFFLAFWKFQLRFSLVRFQLSKDSYLWGIYIKNNVDKIFQRDSALAFQQTAATSVLEDNNG